jgi:PhnB protein
MRPEGYQTVTPWIVSRDTAQLLDFLAAAFDAQEIARVYNPDGITIGHAEVRIGDAVVMMFDSADGWPDTPAFLRLYVEDSDAVYRRALEAGAVSVTEPTDLFFGDLVGRVCDPLGNVWWIQTHIEDVPLEELGQRAHEQSALDAMHTSRARSTRSCGTDPKGDDGTVAIFDAGPMSSGSANRRRCDCIRSCVEGASRAKA